MVGEVCLPVGGQVEIDCWLLLSAGKYTPEMVLGGVGWGVTDDGVKKA